MYSVLCVDDDPEILDLYVMYLERSKKIRVIKEKSAKKALDLLKEHLVDAVISDYRMPEMDGITFLKQVRIFSRNLPFFLFTGKGDEDVAMDAMNLGANFYIKKGGAPRETFRDLEDRILSAIHLVSDEEALKKKIALFDRMNEASPLAIAAFDDHLKCVYANGKFLKAFGNRHKILGTRVQDLFPYTPKERDSFMQWIREECILPIEHTESIRWIFRCVCTPEEDLFIATYGISSGDLAPQERVL